MGCSVTKCSTPTCSVSMKACQLINGKCPSCYEKQKAAEAQFANTPKTP